MPMYNLLEYSNNYGKTLASLWQYFRNEPHHNGIIYSESCKLKSRFTSNTDHTSTVNVEIAVPLEYLNNFCRYRCDNSL